MGATCASSSPMSIIVQGRPSPSSASSQPCEENKGFISNLFSSIFSFLFNTNKNSQPCDTSTQNANNSGGASETGGTLASIEFIGHTTAKVEGEDMEITVEAPAGVKSGDVMVAMIGSDYAHVNAAPQGWNLIRQDVKNEGHLDDLALQSYFKIVTNQEEGNYTWKLMTLRKDTPSSHQPLIFVDLYAFSGVDSSNPILSDDASAENPDSNAIECPSVNGVEGGMLLCSFVGDDPGSLTLPGSMNQTSNTEVGGGEGDVYAAGLEELTSDGNTGSRIAVWNNPSNKNGSDFSHAIVLKPGR